MHTGYSIIYIMILQAKPLDFTPRASHKAKKISHFFEIPKYNLNLGFSRLARKTDEKKNLF